MNKPIIALLTDLGTKDYFVGAMKGAILSINPDAKIVDITHGVQKYDILSAAFTLLNASKTFPTGTIFIVVVDPGVGTKRKILLLKTRDGKFFIGPDNGVLSLVAEKYGVAKIHRVTNRKLMMHEISSTFHGRDIMAPVAAHLSLGIETSLVGSELKKIKSLKFPKPFMTKNELKGQVISVDDFGNLITNIDRETVLRFVNLGESLMVDICGKKIPLKFVKTFGEVKRGEYLCYVGSAEMLELGKNMGNACRELKVKTLSKLTFRRGARWSKGLSS